MTRFLATSVGVSAGLMGLLLSLGLPWLNDGGSPVTGWGMLGEAVAAPHPPVLALYSGVALVFLLAAAAYRGERAARYRAARVSACLLPFLMLLLWPWDAGPGMGPGAVTAMCACAVIALTTGRAGRTVD